MKRVLIPRDELLDWMTKELHKRDPDRDVKHWYFDNVMPSDPKENNGCNWQRVVSLAANAGFKARGTPLVRKITLEAQKRFNVKWD